MADDAFALSPLSARASLPSEADYDAIRDAFMETTRGRWFLTQYAARNRNADTTAVLDAVARIESGLAANAPAMPSLAEIVAAIRPLIAEARDAADAAMAVPDMHDKIAAGRRGARIIREISWSLRETGTDPRICNILDAQLLALETLHEHLVSDSRPAEIGELFDDLALQVEQLRVEGIAGAQATARKTAPRQEPTPEPVETVGANAAFAASVAVPVTAEPESAPTAGEIAADDAVLDLIAIEMAAPEIDIGRADRTRIDDDFDQVDERIADLRNLSGTASAPAAPATPPLPPSLGAAILAGGVVRAPRAGDDPLAPFRRMSQIEKIAFFS